MVVYEDAFARGLRRLQESYLAHSLRLDRQAWSRRSATQRFRENLANLMSPLL